MTIYDLVNKISTAVSASTFHAYVANFKSSKSYTLSKLFASTIPGKSKEREEQKPQKTNGQ